MCYTTIMRGGEYEKGKNRQSGIHCKETQAGARRMPIPLRNEVKRMLFRTMQ